ncbi:MAG: YhjD/YihY/BrkB family envelope integrity protein [Candidatus Rariloculaceae bacterium]
MDSLIGRLNSWLWERDPPEDIAGRVLLTSSRYLYAMLRELSTGELNMRAMSLVYTTMLAIVPLLALIFSILKGFGYHERMEPLLQAFLEPLGPRGDELTATIIGFVDNVQESALAGISLALLLYTALSMAQKVENSFNFIWRVNRPRSFSRRFSEYLSVLLVGPLLMTISMGMLATIQNVSIVDRLGQTGQIGSLVVRSTEMIPYVLVIFAFSFLYSFVPNITVRIRTAIVGGLLAGITWAACGELFATFVAGTTRTTLIYSGFAIVIFGMLWLYVSWLILLAGAQFTFFHQNPDYLRLETRTPNASNDTTERLAINIMLLVSKATDDAWEVSGLASRIDVPRHMLEPVIAALQRANLLAETTDGRLVPIGDIRKIGVVDILTAVRRSPTDGQIAGTGRWNPAVNTAAERVDSALNDAVGSQSLADLVDTDAAPAN